MRNICRQSRRWHQQFFASTDRLGHRPCLLQRRSPIFHQHRHYARGNEDDVVVHEFEQLGTDKKTRVAINSKAGIEKTEKYLRSKLDKLDNELSEMSKGPFAPEGEFMQSLSPEERQVALEALEREGVELPADLGDMDMEELDRMVEEQDREERQREDEDEEVEEDEAEIGGTESGPAPQVTLDVPQEQRPYIRAFNALLAERVVNPSTHATKLNLWKSYQRCGRHVPNFSSLLPGQAWDILWESQVDLRDNTLNMRALCEHMLAESVPLSPERSLVYIDTLRSAGDFQAAISQWNSNRSLLGRNLEIADRFWRLGVRIYSEDNQPNVAQDIALQCLDHGSFVDAAILVPVISAWARQKTRDGLEKSWACYLRFKAELGTAITPKDYETVSTILLKEGHPDLALAVFKDLAVDRLGHANRDDSVSSFRRLAGYVGEMQVSAINEHEVNKVSLAALTILPPYLQNKYFFGAWLKTLIGRGHVDSAAQVIELMYERGVKPDGRHLNGIIGAWLREGSKASREKAEQIAWAMVDARIEFVKNREKRTRPATKSATSPFTPFPPIRTTRPIPLATVETFSILLVHYLRRSNDQPAERLMDLMTNQALIAPNAYIHNHWMYASLRGHDIQSVWIQYENLKRTTHPDLQTFACLWDTAKLQADHSRAAHWAGFPSPRRLFREMHDWLTNLPTAPGIRARQEFSADLYDQIIRVFCLSDDLRGALCALHGLKQLFGASPTQTTSRIISIQVARRLPLDAKYQATSSGGGGGSSSSSSGGGGGRGRARWRRRVSRMQTAMSDVGDIFRLVTDQRAMTLADAGLDVQTLEDAAQQRFQLDALSDFALVMIRRETRDWPRSATDHELRMVARSMGVDLERVDFRKSGQLLLDEAEDVEEG